MAPAYGLGHGVGAGAAAQGGRSSRLADRVLPKNQSDAQTECLIGRGLGYWICWHATASRNVPTCSGSGTAVMVSPVLSRCSILAKRPADDDERAPYATTGIADHRVDSR